MTHALRARDAGQVRKRRSRVDVLARGVGTSLAVILLAIGVLVTGDWGQVLGVGAALVVIVPLFWLLNHPRHRRRRLRMVVRNR